MAEFEVRDLKRGDGFEFSAVFGNRHQKVRLEISKYSRFARNRKRKVRRRPDENSWLIQNQRRRQIIRRQGQAGLFLEEVRDLSRGQLIGRKRELDRFAFRA